MGGMGRFSENFSRHVASPFESKEKELSDFNALTGCGGIHPPDCRCLWKTGVKTSC
jgi:hypothetical protein